jgi:hypothetical protein
MCFICSTTHLKIGILWETYHCEGTRDESSSSGLGKLYISSGSRSFGFGCIVIHGCRRFESLSHVVAHGRGWLESLDHRDIHWFSHEITIPNVVAGPDHVLGNWLQ